VAIRRWRKMTWVVLVWNVLMVAWIVIAVANDHTTGCGRLSQRLCDDGTTAGDVIGAGIIVAICLIGDIILGILWLVTKGNRHPCPACGLHVKAGAVQCRKCGYDFRFAAPASSVAPSDPPPTAQPAVPAGWFPDPQGSGQFRYWDGGQWTAYTRN
jgi:uncharacterized protein DUF2510